MRPARGSVFVFFGDRPATRGVWGHGGRRAYGTANREALVAGTAASARLTHLERILAMKRLLLVFLLAAAFLGLLAAPALAGLRASLKTAYVVPKTGGVWLEVQGDVNAPTLLVHPPGSLGWPIPANYDVIIDSP